MTEEVPAERLASILAIWLPVAGAGLIGASGLPGLFLPRQSRAGERVSVALHLSGAAFALAGAILSVIASSPGVITAAWGLPLGTLRFELDGLSAAFLPPLTLVPALGSIYGLRYWSHQEQRTGPKLRAFYGVLAASLILLTLARDGVLFLLCWEGMALSAFFLVTTDDTNSEAREAGWVYFIATHVGTLALFGFFSATRALTGSFGFDQIPAAGIGMGSLIFFLGLLAFGVKAGLMPLHVWLPGAHAAAPSHVSAVLSAVVLKTGIYGLARVTWMLPHPPAFWGASLLALGIISGVVGVIFAIAQHDLKRLLAYHSVENIGIIVIGLGLAMLGRSMDRPEWVVLGLGGAILHVWNHCFFKSLLFFSAGSVVHRLHTREIDRMGGLARTMPITAIMFLCGAAAICGLPPFNGFVSELLIYIGLLHTLRADGAGSAPGAAVAVPALAIIGALAVACFVKVFGAVFLGTPREESGRTHAESPRAMLLPMAVLAAACIGIGLLPAGAAPFLDRATETWLEGTAMRPEPLARLVPLWWVSALSLALWVGAGACIFGLFRLIRPRTIARVGTWDCGYAAPSARMQYSSSSFAQALVAVFRWVVHPREHAPRLERHFPFRAEYHSHVHDVVLHEWIEPAVSWAAHHAMRLRVLQTGRVQIYILYILLAVIGLTLSIVPILDLLRSMVTR